MDGNFLNLNNKIKRKVIHESSNFIVKEDRIYNHEGEDISHLYNLSINPVYVSENQLEQYKSKQILGNHEKENGGFVFMFYRTLQNFNEIIPELTRADIARLMFLSTYVSYDDNIIQYDNGSNINDNQLSDLLRFNKQSMKKYISKLINNNIVSINDDNQIVMNKYFCRYGKIDVKELKNNNISYIRMFKKTVRDLFNNTPIREIGRLSVIYMILPYLNLASNIVSKNPEEQIVENVKPMSLMELTQHLGYKDITKFRQSLYNVKINNSYVFGFFMFEDDKRTMRTVINPNVIFAGNAEQLEAIKALFSK